MSKAVIFFAPGLEECEGLLCVDILRRAGVEVTIAAVGGEKIVKSARQISVVADALAEGKKDRTAPDLSNDALARDYPVLYQSLLQVVHNTGERLNALLTFRPGK